MTADSYSLEGINRAMTILTAFDRSPDLSLADIARSAGLREATALRYVTSLTTHGLLERDPATGRYQLGLRLFQLGEDALRGRDPRAIALPHMRRLRDRFEETVNLAMRHGNELILIEVLESQRSIRKGAVLGERDVWDTSALGKAILAYLDEEEARSLLTVEDADAVLAQLSAVRATGYAVDDVESQPDLRCVGAAIFDRRSNPLYALSLSGPANRITPGDIGEMGRELRAAAAAISAALGNVLAVRTQFAPRGRRPSPAREHRSGSARRQRCGLRHLAGRRQPLGGCSRGDDRRCV
jgi:IclR family transcriptional regulator, acetate operon repressor